MNWKLRYYFIPAASLIVILTILGIYFSPFNTQRTWAEGEGHVEGEVHEGHDDHAEHAGHDDDAGHEVHEGHDDHEGHAEHAGHEVHEGHDDHEGHADHADHDDDADHEIHESSDDHSDHADHADEADHAVHADDDGHDHEAHAGEGTSLGITEESLDGFKVRFRKAASGRLDVQKRFTGEIRLNADRLAHIVPRAPGIARVVLKNEGDTVQAGEIMAWIESRELGEAKVDYLSKWAELGCCTIDLSRAEEVRKNTLVFLEELQSFSTLDDLRSMEGGAMGEHRSALVGSFAEYVLAKSVYARERALYEKGISSEEVFLAAESKYKKTEAIYAATLDNVGFDVEREYLEAKQDRKVQEIEVIGAERTLNILGLTADEIESLKVLAETEAADEVVESGCSDPNCQECSSDAHAAPKSGGHEELHEKLAWYPLRAPFAGEVIGKHLSLGEKITDEADAFTVADLGTVWADIRIHQKDLHQVKAGRRILISMPENHLEAGGVIKYVLPVLDERTRTALARVELANPVGEWRPGVFIEARMSTEIENSAIVVPRAAVQRIDGEPVVFVKSQDGIRTAPVLLGRENGSTLEILSGLEAGQRYVAEGAFTIKAKIVTSNLDAHAGHGH